MKTLFFNIKELLQIRDKSISKVSGADMNSLPSIKNAYLLVEGEKIKEYGSMSRLNNYDADRVIDAHDQIIMQNGYKTVRNRNYLNNRLKGLKKS